MYDKTEKTEVRVKLISSYLVVYRKTLSINTNYDEKAAAFNDYYVRQFRLSEPLKITSIMRLPTSIKNPNPKIQAKGSLESIGEFAGRGSSSQEASDRAYFYIFGRLHRLWSFIHRAHAKRELSTDEFYDFLLVESLETIRIVERNKNCQIFHSIVIVDCRQFEATEDDQSEARRKSIEQLRQFVDDVMAKIAEMERLLYGFVEPFKEDALELEYDALSAMVTRSIENV